MLIRAGEDSGTDGDWFTLCCLVHTDTEFSYSLVKIFSIFERRSLFSGLVSFVRRDVFHRLLGYFGREESRILKKLENWSPHFGLKLASCFEARFCF